MSSTSPPPGSAPSPTSPPSPSSNATAAPPTTPAAPPSSSNATAPPLATPSAPPPAGPATPTSSPPPAASPPAPTTPSPPFSSPTPDSNSPPSPPSPPAPAGRSGSSTPSLPLGKAPPASRGVSVSPSSSSSSSSSSSVSTSLVVGVAVGAAVILLLFTILCLCCRRKKRRSPPPLDYYGGLPPPPPQPWKDNPYGGQAQNWEYNAPPPGGHVVKLPVQPTPPPPFPSRPPYPPQSSSSFETPRPPPPPPIISSSGGSGSNYSGSETVLPPPSPGLALGFSKSTFTYEELAIATNGFSDDNLLGQGGFGHVHKGRLPNGKEVAIKRLKSGSGQGEREFQAEVEIISRVHHKHLVSLVGYCISGGQRLLVYEYVSNKTLEFHLHGKDRLTMDWATRLKIALGSAKGLAYLHEDCHPKIIHRDIKAANILLDYRFEAKVADFGLAKLASDENTHVSTRVMGTFGYLAPEYALSGKLTDKSDVFSFGVMLLEIITGRRPVDTTQSFMDDSLVDWARPLLTCALEEGNYDTLIDPRMGKNYNPNEMACMIACAAACIRHSARRRPRMSQIVRALEGNASLEDLNEGVRPGHSTLHGSYGSTDYDSGHYNEDMKRFRKMALASQNYTASGYSEPTSEYGQIPSASSSEGQLTREMEIGWRKRESQGLSNSS